MTTPPGHEIGRRVDDWIGTGLGDEQRGEGGDEHEDGIMT